MHPKIVVYDACVLYPAPLRDLLIRLAMAGLFQAKWSDMIHQEWIESVLNDRQDITQEKLTRTRQLMDSHVPNALVTDYDILIPDLSLPDTNDRHVLAAAIACKADVILTFNLKDFPLESLTEYDIKAIHPDDFVYQFLTTAKTIVLETMRLQRASLNNPPKSVEQYLHTLANQRLTQTTLALAHFPDDL